MKPITLYHNPRCTKSREANQCLLNHHIHANVVEYLKTLLSVEELKALVKKLGVDAHSLIRTSESIYKEHYKGKTLSESEWLQAIAEHPILMQRPIVVKGNKAWIVRPPLDLDTFIKELTD